MVDDSKTYDERKLHLTMKIDLMLSKDSNEKLMYSKSNKKRETMIGNNTNEIIE